MKLVDLLNVLEQYTRIDILISKDSLYRAKDNTPLFLFELLKNIYFSEEKYNKIKNYFDYEVIGLQVKGMATSKLEIVIYKEEIDPELEED